MVGPIEVADDGDLERLAELSETLIGLFDPRALAQRTARELYRILGLPLISVAVWDHASKYAMRGVFGARTDQFRQVRLSAGEGLGGLAVLERRPVEVQDYASDPRITRHFADVVNAEGLGGVVAVPVEYAGELVGLLYGGVRSIGSIGERAKTVLQQAADDVAPMMSASIRASATIQQRVDAERQRIASDLHDDVGQLLFSICVAAQRLRAGSNENLLAVAERIEVQAQEATQRLRQAFQMMAPSSPCEAVAAAIQREIDDFQERSDLAAYFVVRGSARSVPPSAEGALVGAARQALFNVERHACASLVVATLHFDDSAVSLVVQDDGSGLPEDFELGAIPRGDQHWGLASILRQAQCQGGDLEVRSGEDGGTTVRITLPIENRSE